MGGTSTVDGNGHINKPGITDTGGCCEQPRIALNAIRAGNCFGEPLPDSNDEFNYSDPIIEYPPGSFDPDYPCQTDSSGTACDSCIKTENPEQLIPWPAPAFGQPTNPLPSIDSITNFPPPTNSTNTFYCLYCVTVRKAWMGLFSEKSEFLDMLCRPTSILRIYWSVFWKPQVKH